MAAPEAKASGKLWDGALDAQHALGDLDGHRPALLGVHDAFGDGIAYRAELSDRVEEAVPSADPILRQGLGLPASWWEELAGTLEKLSGIGTGRVAVREAYMARAIPQFVKMPAPPLLPGPLRTVICTGRI
ncbi:hypothetical protein [Streptomyces sp. NPDC006333]|uniref:hypothetical protein n=1 Tax=Streptomyces sp. NPDC006333 TaxID=3156753 RepID=UPI0033A5DF2F